MFVFSDCITVDVCFFSSPMHPFQFTLIIAMDQQLNVSVSIVHIFAVYSSDATCSLKCTCIEICIHVCVY